MKRIEKASLFACLFSTAIGVFPVLTFFVLNGRMDRNAVFGGVLLLTALAAVLNRLTPEKYSRTLPKIYSAILTVGAFFISLDAPMFYRLVVSTVVLTLSIFMQKKNEQTVTGVYAFVLITFLDVLFCFIISYTFPQIDITMHLFYYLIYAVCFGIMTALRSRARFLKGRAARVNKGIIFVPAIAIGVTALLSIPLSRLASRAITALLRVIFSDVGGGNTNRPIQAQSDKPFSPDDLGITQGGPLVRYIIIAVCALFALSMIVYLRREIAEFLSRLPLKFRRKNTAPEKITRHEEYTDFVSAANERSAPRMTHRKMWRKKLREYRRMEWSVEKMRTGLELAQNGLMLSGTEIRDCDTVLDIEKNLPQEIAPYWHRAAVCYMNCRYDGAVPQKSDEQDFERLIKKVSAMQ